MSRENDDAVLRAIKQIEAKMDYENPKHLRLILQMVQKSDGFLSSVYGKQYISSIKERLAHIENKAHMSEEKSENDPSRTGQRTSMDLDQYLRQSDEKLESFFRDVDDSLFQVASQKSMRTAQKLLWFNLGLTVINTIVIFFIALYLWNLNMGR